MREECPNCGAELPHGARVCPECGSDEQTGWSEAAQEGGLDLPEEQFDYEGFVKREFETKSPVPRGLSKLWWVVGLILLALLVMLWFRR